MHPLVIGHRGASGYRPEHTRSAYELAFALGADAVEPDVVASKDGVLVVRHENQISETTDVADHPEFAARHTTKTVDGKVLTGWFTEDFTWGELRTLGMRERLPALRKNSASFDGQFPMLRLRDVMKLVDRAAEIARAPRSMVAELKHPSYFASIGLPLDELFAAEINRAGWNAGDGRLITESFEPTVLAQLHARGVYGKRILLLEARGKPVDLVSRLGADAPRYAHYLTDAGLYDLRGTVDGVSVPKSLILETDEGGTVTGASPLVDAAHAAGLYIYCWSLRPENRFLAPSFRRGRYKAQFGNWSAEFRTIMGSGVDGVFVDHPDLAVMVRAELQREEELLLG
ncbi:glycerophosphodiester phosphodiesterase [Cryobacterium melibiosiphilum]|uniref:glycerophosphodiester phosphodiesterase n=1 Tax=Cryobacterium melibiosiphilum TaxID=995039 RepID=A0A3A5MZL3_9MICO|nr:glycerophosphodiester phosphodiesterase family protein [Cryobacterium melibiosiphilum]RJT90544.1 glycerophosphodiester phosphodiesterase [Cryobacterium melibiosiphilum]